MPFWEESDRPQCRAVVRFDDERSGPISYEFIAEDAAEAARWSAVAIQNVQRGVAPPAQS